MSETLPTRDEDLALHRRLLDRHPVAPSQIADTFLAPLIDWLSTRNPRIEQHLLHDAAHDTLVSLIKNPTTFDPGRQKGEHPLFSFLKMSAQRDLQNLLEKETRHRSRIVPLTLVEDSADGRKYLGREDPSLAAVQFQEDVADANTTILANVRDGLAESELRALDLMLQGERKTAPFAQALGIEHLPKEEQAAAVKKVKDKLKKRLERSSHGHAT